MSKIGKNIKKIRTVKNLNQAKLAELLGLSRASVGAYEEMRAEPKIESLIKLATHFKLDLGRLINEELTVNEINGFKQAEKLVLLEPETPSIPAKPKSIAYYFNKDGKLKDSKIELKWPIQGKKEAIAVQVSTNLCLVMRAIADTDLETSKEIAIKTSSAFVFDYLKGISEDEIQLSKHIVKKSEVICYYQATDAQGTTNARLSRLEKIIEKLV